MTILHDVGVILNHVNILSSLFYFNFYVWIECCNLFFLHLGVVIFPTQIKHNSTIFPCSIYSEAFSKVEDSSAPTMKVENMLLAMLEEKREGVDGFHLPFLLILMTLIQMHKNQWLYPIHPLMETLEVMIDKCIVFLIKLISRLKGATYHLHIFLLCSSGWV